MINITGGHDLTLFELDEAANRIREEVDADANIIVGSTLDTDMEGAMRVSVVATGIDARDVNLDIPVPRRSLAQPLKQTVSVEEEAEERVQEEAEPKVAASTYEPELFNDFDSQNAAAEEQMDDIFADDAAASEYQDEDGLPAPAYRPQVAAFQPQTDAIDADPEEFVAPTSPAPGTPSRMPWPV